jgi:pimeloyl-ACP methyl ester carboxylesterase
MNRVNSPDGTTIALDRSGSGPALVLVVGAFSDRSSTKTLAAGLASQFTVYEYDRRGRGDSTDTAPWAIAREVEDLAAVVAQAGGSAFLFGHSSGGALALEAAARGVPTRGVVAYEPPYTTGPSTTVGDELDALVAAGQHSEAAERFLALFTPPQVISQMKAGPYWAHLQSFAGTLPYEVRLSNDETVPTDRLAAITAPTLVLAGGDSPDWARDTAERVAAAIPAGRWRVLEGQSHGVADEVLIPILKQFFAP